MSSWSDEGRVMPAYVAGDATLGEVTPSYDRKYRFVHAYRGKQAFGSRRGKLLSVIEIQTFNTRDEQEVAGYAAVMETIFASCSVLTLTERRRQRLDGMLSYYHREAA
jgi:hypothetical protein